MNSRVALAAVALLLVAAAYFYLQGDSPQAEPTGTPEVHPAPVSHEGEEANLESNELAENETRQAAEEGPIEALAVDPAVQDGLRILRVLVDGIPADQAPRTTVTVRGMSEADYWPSHLSSLWSCQGLTSEFNLEPFFQGVEAATHWDLNLTGLAVEVYHPERLIETVEVPLASGVRAQEGRTLYEARATLVPGTPYVFWPEFTLSILDARSRAHLDGVELRCVNTALMGTGQQPGDSPMYTWLGEDLASPIGLLGGRPEEASEQEVFGLAIGSAQGEAPRLRKLMQPEEVARGVLVYARAPGYAWNRFVLDVSKGTNQELLLEPGAALDLSLQNVQFEGYAALGADPTLTMERVNEEGRSELIWFRELDELVAAEGVEIDSLLGGDYTIRVELGGRFSWRQRPVLALQEFALTPGETHELLVVLEDPPAPRTMTSISGTVSVPEYPRQDMLTLLLYDATTYRNGPADFELQLKDQPRVSGPLPTWSFHVEELPAGTYQAELWPVMKSWMFEVPDGGRNDLQFLLTDLAEVLVETVDADTGERIPLEDLRYGDLEELPGRVRGQWVRTLFHEEPGRFRIWTAPGPAYVKTHEMPEGLQYGYVEQVLDLAPGPQSVTFEVTPLYAIRFDFRLDGATLPSGDQVTYEVLSTIRAVGHDGQAQGISSGYAEMDAPGLYEVTFEGVGQDRFHPIPPQQVEVRGGEVTPVVVDLQRK